MTDNNKLIEAAAKVLGLPVRDLAVPPGAVWWDVPHLKHDSETLMFPGDGGYTLRELVSRGTTQRWEDRKWNPPKSVDDALMVADVLRAKGYSIGIDGDANGGWSTNIYRSDDDVLVAKQESSAKHNRDLHSSSQAVGRRAP